MCRVAIGVLVGVLVVTAVAAADTTAPVYTSTYNDCVTGPATRISRFYNSLKADVNKRKPHF